MTDVLISSLSTLHNGMYYALSNSCSGINNILYSLITLFLTKCIKFPNILFKYGTRIAQSVQWLGYMLKDLQLKH